MAAAVSQDSELPPAPSSEGVAASSAPSSQPYPHLPIPQIRPRSTVHMDYDTLRHEPKKQDEDSLMEDAPMEDAPKEDAPKGDDLRELSEDLRRYSINSLGLTRISQNQQHLMRSSPPIQPGENADKLPSFSEVSQTLIQRYALMLRCHSS